MPFATQEGLVPGHILLDGNSASPKRGHNHPPIFRRVYWHQRAGWMKVALGTGVGPGPDNIVLDRDPAPSPKKVLQPPPLFSPYLLCSNGWMDQDATWYGDRPQPRPHCVRCRPSSPHGKGHSSPHFFAPCLLWPNGRPSHQLLSSFSFHTHCWLLGWLVRCTFNGVFLLHCVMWF